MKSAVLLALALLAATPAFATDTTATSGVTGTGAQVSGMASRTVGTETVTVTFGNGVPPVVSVAPNTAAPGTSSGSLSVSASIGGVLGAGFGNTAGTAGTSSAALKF